MEVHKKIDMSSCSGFNHFLRDCYFTPPELEEQHGGSKSTILIDVFSKWKISIITLIWQSKEAFIFKYFNTINIFTHLKNDQDTPYPQRRETEENFNFLYTVCF